MKKRIISAVVALIILVPLIILGGIPFYIGAAFLSAVGFWELLRIYYKDRKVPLLVKVLSYLSVILLTLSLDSFNPAIGISLLLIFIPIIFINKEEYNVNDAIQLFGRIMFVGFIFHTMIGVRESSLEEFIFLFLISSLTDTFAYIGGSLFGRHKLIPRISPNKTIEGSLFGLGFGTLIPALYYIYMVDPGFSILYILFVSAILSIFGQLGDLLFSAMKRKYEIKDFSNIMPGHGGVLDRLDSLSIIMIVYLIIKTIFI